MKIQFSQKSGAAKFVFPFLFFFYFHFHPQFTSSLQLASLLFCSWLHTLYRGRVLMFSS